MNEGYEQREIEEWKRSMLELPDELFFSIMRIYLGEIRTPFHKPALVDRLSLFLSHGKTIRRITALTDEKDTVFLTAVDILERPHISDLYTLFEEETDYFSFHGRLRNLQERLLVYHRRSDDTIALNPLLEPSLRRHVLNPSLLFEFRKMEEPQKTEEESKSRGEHKRPPVTESFLWALICFLFTEDNVLKADGTLKKKSRSKLEHIFSGYEVSGEIELSLRSAVRLGLVVPRENRLIPNLQLIDKFSELPRKERITTAWAASCFGFSTDRSKEAELSMLAGPVPPKELRRRRYVLLSLLESMPDSAIFTLSGIRRLIRISAFFAGTHERYLPIRPEDMVELGLLIEIDEGVCLSSEALRELYEEPSKHPILIQPDFTVTIKPPLDFSRGIRIGELFDIRSYDVYPRFELTKHSYTRARSRRFGYEELVRFLKEHSDTPPPHNILMTISAWERSFSGIKLYEGIVLQVDEERSHLVDHTPHLQEHILHSFGHGIYLLDPFAVEEWTKALEKSGIEPLPPIHRPGIESKEDSQTRGLDAYAPINTSRPAENGRSGTRLPIDLHSPPPEPKNSEEGSKEGIKKELERTIEKLELNTNQRREILNFIDNKLVLFPEQLGLHILSGEITEARGIDYSGKVRIVEQSVSHSHDLLEIVIRMPTGKPKRMLLLPERLEKGEKELYVNGKELPNGEMQRVPVGKISYVKRWKSSLFSNREDSSPQ
ncbi:MAG: hypothetical protein R6V67_10750 [Spirochaetia bacterium]